MKAHIAHVALSIYSHLHYWSYYLLKSPRLAFISKCIGKAMYLEKPKRIIIWNGEYLCQRKFKCPVATALLVHCSILMLMLLRLLPVA